MNIRYWVDHLDEETILNDSAATNSEPLHINVAPEICFRQVRETMEEFAYRTAMTYTPEGKPSLYYWTTTKGISCHEVRKNNECTGSS